MGGGGGDPYHGGGGGWQHGTRNHIYICFFSAPVGTGKCPNGVHKHTLKDTQGHDIIDCRMCLDSKITKFDT